ncbi:hypothetical protein P22_1473 [Propionispora sp. 2/2-37]|uniref:FGGY-family carbohydrate kinase n=1 Tax=Propionispora sp. 2/2-37 TaxID=1677858 RepID=UPI0006BB8F80|nr:FGGY family carbohydrate kinase [Propionispora sp. 2/2-37]CUH95403.1 hypothetical protein P22_1473 [Propionispora sp. 2/2-37]
MGSHPANPCSRFQACGAAGKTEYFIGVDIGSTNCKVCAYDVRDFSEAACERFTTPQVTCGKQTDFLLDDIWHTLKKVLAGMFSRLSGQGRIVHIAIASVGESGVLVDDKGEAIGPVIAWFDTRTEEQVRKNKDRISEQELYGICGLNAHSNYSAYKILWLKEHAGVDRPCRWVSLAGYIAYKLTGEIHSEPTLASRTMLLDLRQRQWSETLLDKLNIEKSMLPDLVPSGQAIGTVRPELKREFQVEYETGVSIAGHDHMCGAFGIGLTSSDSLLNSTGTTEGLLALSGGGAKVEERHCSHKLSHGLYVLDAYTTLFGSLPAAGLCFQWLKEMFFANEKSWERIWHGLGRRIKNDLLFIPHLRGSGPPLRNVQARGLLYGLEDTTGCYDVARAVLEGVCFELKALRELMHPGSVPAVKVIGSAVHNPLWLQYKADVLGCSVEAYDVNEAVARGAALLAAYKAGYVDEAFIKKLNRKVRVYEPDWKQNGYLQEKYEQLYVPASQLKIELEQRERRKER